MSNAAKLKKKAAEFEQKKQFDKALQLYIQILDESDGDDEEADVALYNRVGDLLMRQGSVGDAVNYYEKAVDLYAESGFFNNAIALCNKILRQSPGRNSIYYKLGKISAKKGFISDAKQNFLEYADRMQKAGQLDEAFRALKEFADLCPDQDDIRLMLAEQLSKKDRKGEAIEQLQHLYEKFTAEGRGAEARATVDRMKAIDPSVEPKTGGANRREKSSDLIFIDLSDSAPAKAADREPSRKTVKLPVSAEVDALDDLPLLDTNDAGEDDLLPLPPLDEADLEPLDVAEVSGLETMAEFSAEAVEAGTISGFEQTVLDDETGAADTDTAEPSEATAADESDEIDGVDDVDDLLPDLEPPLSGSEFAELELGPPTDEHPDARAHTHDLALPGRLPSLDDHGPGALSLTGEMELIIPEVDIPPIPPLRRKSGPSARPAPLAAPPLARPPNGALEVDFTPEVDASDIDGRSASAASALPLIDGADSLRPATPSDGDAAQTWSNGDAPAEALGELPMLDDETPAAPAPVAEEPPPVAEPVVSDDDLIDDVLLNLDKPSARRPSGGRRVSGSKRVSGGSKRVSGGGKRVSGSGKRISGSGKRIAAPMRHSQPAPTPSVNDLREQSVSDADNWTLRRQLAEALLEDGDRAAGLQELEAVMLGLEHARDLEGARSVADEIIRLDPNSVRHHQKRVEYAFRAADKPRLAEMYLELADALFRAGHADKARAVYQRVLELAPDDLRAQAALSTFGPPVEETDEALAVEESAIAVAESPADGDFVNLSDWLQEDEAPKSTRMVVDEEAPSGDEAADFNDMLRKFKQGVAENVDDEDFESHYDLGVAYKEMGLVDEAIAQFQKALRGARGRVRTYEALGQCFLEKQQFRVAATILGRALTEPGVADDQLVGVLYLLGYASEALRAPADALMYYQRVFAVDIQFRDVADRLARLEKVGR